MPIEFCDLLSDEEWVPLAVDPADPHSAMLAGSMWQSTKVDPSFNAFGMRCRAGFTIPRRHHNLRHLVIIFGGEATVAWGADGEEGQETFGLGDFWVTDAGTAYTLTAGDDGVVYVESWSEPVDRLETHWHDRVGP